MDINFIELGIIFYLMVCVSIAHSKIAEAREVEFQYAILVYLFYAIFLPIVVLYSTVISIFIKVFR